MKKILLSGLMLISFALTSMAQEPACQNQGALEARIDAIEASGWVESSRSFQYINYLVQPDSPYLIGTLQVVFVPDCEAGEPCPEIARLYQEDAIQQNDNVCIWRRHQN